MRLRFDESKIRYYADKYLESELGYDNPVESIVGEVKGRGYLTKSGLIALSYWVKNRSTYLVKRHRDDLIKEVTAVALSSDTAEPDRINRLLELDGVGWAVGSAILHWFHQDDYPIWTGTARYSVHLDETRGTPRIGEWEAYVSFCRSLAKKNKVNMRTLDRALWKYCDDQRA